MKVICPNCGGKRLRCGLTEIPDLLQRVEPGGIVPAGECAKCGALAYRVTRTRYLLKIWGDVEPEIAGPFKTNGSVLKEARKYREQEGDEHGVYPLTIDSFGHPIVYAFSGSDFE